MKSVVRVDRSVDCLLFILMDGANPDSILFSGRILRYKQNRTKNIYIDISLKSRKSVTNMKLLFKCYV